MTEKQVGVSINPDDFSKGGILNDVDALLKVFRFVSGDQAVEANANMGNYPNVEETLFLQVLIVEDESGEQTYEHWSSGKLEYFEPSDDGTRAVAVGSAQKLSDSCNAFALISSIVNAGYPKDQLSDSVGIFDGLKTHMIRVEQKKRAGLSGGEGERARTVLTVESIFEPYPWEGGKGKRSKTKAAVLPLSKDGGSEIDVLANIASETVLEILIDADGGPIKKTSLYQRMIKKLAKNKQKRDIIKIAADDEWLAESELWQFDGKELEVAGE